MCFGPGAQILLPPSREALNLGAYVKACLSLIGALMVVRFIGGLLIYGIIDLFVIFLGAMTFRSQEGWGVRPIFCLNLISFFMTGIFTVECFMFLFDGGKYSVPLWQWYFFVGAILGAPLFYVCLGVFSYKLLREMKRVESELVNEMMGGLGGEDSINQPIDIDPSGNLPQPHGWGGFFGRGNDRPVEPSANSHMTVRYDAPAAEQPAARSESPNGFTPYSGQGHKLGDTVV